MGLHAVSRAEFTGGVEVPYDAAVASIVSAQVAVQRSRKDNAGNDCRGRHLRSTAAERAYTRGLRRGGGPDLFAGSQIQREHPAPGKRIVIVIVGQWIVGVPAVGRASPLN